MKTMKVLVVEDNVAQAESLGDLLRFQGHRPLLAGDGNQAIEQVKLHGCDAAIVDLMMPGMGGRLFVNWLRTEPATEKVPVVISTGLPLDHPRLEGLDSLPGVLVLQKPFEIERMLTFLGLEEKGDGA